MHLPSYAPQPPQPRVSARAAHQRKRSLIKLTPLIDVVFILLVFFMLASNFLDWRAIDLKTPTQVAGGASLEGAYLVEVRSDGLRLSGQAVSLDKLTARIEQRLAAKPDQRVVVKPAVGVALQPVVLVLDRLAAAGVADLSLFRDDAG